MKCLCLCVALMAIGVLEARSYDFKFLGTKGSSEGNRVIFKDKTKCGFFQVRIGQSLPSDDQENEIDIRAATVFKNVKTKAHVINDVAKFMYLPTNTTGSTFFEVKTGIASCTVDTWKDVVADYSRGWQFAGVVIELWQGGKRLKHWTNVPGKIGKIQLTDNVECFRLGEDGYEVDKHSEFKNATKIYPVSRRSR